MSGFGVQDPEDELELLELLGEGAYGAVYKAQRKADGNIMAVKIIPAGQDAADLKKEISIMMKCSSQYIVTLHNCYYKDDEAWLVMDYCGGGSVSDIMEACKITLSESEVRACMAWSLLGLVYLHGNRKLHRDIKAANVLLSGSGQAKLADFGVSKEVNTLQNKAKTVIGTPYWMAPEVIQEVPYDARADVWSLGITAIEMAEGQPPLSNVNAFRAIFMIPSKPPPTLKEPDKWTPEFRDFISKCLVKKPEDRPSTADLLQHPWVRDEVATIRSSDGRKGSEVLRNLVSRHMDGLEAFREEASVKKAEQDQQRQEEEQHKATMKRKDAQQQQASLGSSRGGTASLSRDSSVERTGSDDDDASVSSSGSVVRYTDDGGRTNSTGSMVRGGPGGSSSGSLPPFDALETPPMGGRVAGAMKHTGTAAEHSPKRVGFAAQPTLVPGDPRLGGGRGDGGGSDPPSPARKSVGWGDVAMSGPVPQSATPSPSPSPPSRFQKGEGSTKLATLVEALQRLDSQYKADMEALRATYMAKRATLEAAVAVAGKRQT